MDNRKLTTEHTESTEKLTAKSAKNAKILKGFFLSDLRGSKKELCGAERSLLCLY
jgi:hypothetical protein